MIELGRTYKDKITGFKGVCTGYVRYITGCNQALLVPKVDKDGKPVEAHWYDEQRLTVSGKSVVKVDNEHATGPDTPAPTREG